MGEDADGAFIRDSLAAEGLDVSGLRMVPGGKSSQATVIVDEQGQRLVVPFHDPELDAGTDWLPLDRLDGVGMVHCDVRWPAGAEAALRAALVSDRCIPCVTSRGCVAGLSRSCLNPCGCWPRCRSG